MHSPTERSPIVPMSSPLRLYVCTAVEPATWIRPSPVMTTPPVDRHLKDLISCPVAVYIFTLQSVLSAVTILPSLVRQSPVISEIVLWTLANWCTRYCCCLNFSRLVDCLMLPSVAFHHLRNKSMARARLSKDWKIRGSCWVPAELPAFILAPTTSTRHKLRRSVKWDD